MMGEKAFTVVYMALVAALFTAGVSVVHMATARRVELNRELAEKRVVMRVLRISVPPDATAQEAVELYECRIRPTDLAVETGRGRTRVLAGISEEGQPEGFAFQVAGQGFWDEVRGYLAVEPDLETLRGLAFFGQSETPGLGAEIASPWFEDQFRGLTLPQEPGPDGLLVRLVRAGEEAGPNDVDAITGATGTSKAVERLINAALLAFRRAVQEDGPPTIRPEGG